MKVIERLNYKQEHFQVIIDDDNNKIGWLEMHNKEEYFFNFKKSKI